jgi:hypothetical protein
MTTERSHDNDTRWESIGEAAEHFARRVARDAGRFAERLEEHTSEFAREMSHEWRRARRRYRRPIRRAEVDVQQVFEDVRTVLADIVDGIDEFIERLIGVPRDARHPAAAPPEPTDATWIRLVSNRVATCAACGHVAEAGEEVFACETVDGVIVRCLDCGVPEQAPPS